ncbi:MAG: MATE family efflux transporter [Terracidiphilus sp.]
MLALADQVMVSASNFGAGIVLVRGLGLSEFGKYTVAYAFLLYANSLQMSFIASPMLSLAPLMEGEAKRQFVNGMLALQLVASLVLFMAFALVGSLSRFFTPLFSIPEVFAFACCVGTYQLQDWLRRYYFLSNRGQLAIATDFISYCLQVLALFVLWRLHGLTLFRAFVVICATSLAAVVMGPITDRLRPELGHLRKTWEQCKSLSHGLLVSSQVRWFGSQGVFLFGTVILGTAVVGGLRAAQYVCGPLYLFLLALENVIPIRIAEELRRKGPEGAHAFTQRTILTGIAISGLIILPIAIFGRPLLAYIYGPAVSVFYVPMLLTLMFVVLQGATSMWQFLYRGVKDTRAIITVNILNTSVNLATVYWFGHRWQATGIVLSVIAGQAIALYYCFLHWRRFSERLLMGCEQPGD